MAAIQSIATKWIYDFSEGSREMRDLLGGKGAGIAEMTRVLGRGHGARGVHDHHRGLRGVHARRPLPPGSPSRSTRRSRASRNGSASGWAIPRIRCWSRCAPARASRCRGCSTRC